MFLDYFLSNKKKLKVSGNPIKMAGIEESKISKKAPNLDENKIEIFKMFNIKI